MQLRALGYILTAMVLGALIGLDREIADKPAGLRTHMLVAGGAAMMVSLSDVIVTFLSLREGEEVIRVDPVRIIDAIITGISFIGAGTIIHSRQDDSVEGVTTAASILFVAGIGIAVALNQIVVAIGSTLLVLISLRIILWFSARITD
jgi:putative Mg2+ transporter-C (MgtC) family protein